MDSFEDLNLSPALIEALAAEGIERPTALQTSAIPVLLRGNNLVARAGPGAGVTVAVGVPLLDRLEPAAGGPVALVVAPTSARAHAMAGELGRLALATAHRVAVLDAGWALPEQASVVVTTPHAIHRALRESRIDLSNVSALVVDGATTLATQDDAWSTVETLFEVVPDDAQRVVVALPITDRVQDFVDTRVRRSVTVPPGEPRGAGPDRGSVQVRTVDYGGHAEALTTLAGELLTDGVHHLMVFTASEDAAVELADTLSLHGFPAGGPGETDFPVWVGVDPLEARPALDEHEADTLVVVSADVPADPDDLDRRHGGGRGGWILARADELAHLRDVAQRTGYTVQVQAPAAPPRDASELGQILAAAEAALDQADVDAYHIVLAPLFERHGAERVAAALLGALRTRPEVLKGLALLRAPAPEAAAGGGPGSAPSRRSPPSDMVKLFISIGEKDGARPGDLVGAITGEARIDGDLIGRIDVRDSFSRVEVAREVSEKVIKALNGTTVRGRSVRVDLDRSERGGGSGGRGSGGRGPGGAGGRGSGARGGRPPRGGPGGRGPRGGPRSD